MVIASRRCSTWGGVMRGRSALVAGLAVTGMALGVAPADARPIEKGHVHDVFTEDPFDCDGTPAQLSADVRINFLFNQRRSAAFPYYRQRLHGTAVYTNLSTGGTYSNGFSG